MADVTTGLTTAEIFQLLVRRVAQGLRIPRCSIILAKPGDMQGTVVAAYEDPSIQSLPVDLTRYPELRRALDTGEVVHVEDVATDPLYEAVRDAWRADGLPVPLRSAIAIRFELRGEPAGRLLPPDHRLRCAARPARCRVCPRDRRCRGPHARADRGGRCRGANRTTGVSVRRCPRCQLMFEPPARFCARDGTPLADVEAAQEHALA